MTLYPYIGQPGALRRLPMPTQPLDAPGTRGDSVVGNLGGGSAKMSWLNAKKTHSLGYDYLPPDAGDLITGLYEGLYGRGPFVFVDPFTRNVLPFDTAACGARTEPFHGWHASHGTVTRSGTPPEEAPDSAVLTWSSLAAGATLEPGTVAAAPDLASAPVWLDTESCSVSLWLSASSAESVTFQLAGYDAAGSLVTTALETVVALTTAWRPVALTAGPFEPALAGVVFVQPRILLGGTVPTSVSIAAAQVEYADAPTEWQRGYGSPRVHIASTPGRTTPQGGYVNHTLALRET